MLLAELGQRPLSHAWWQRTIRFWNSLVAAPPGALYRQVALDALWYAITHNTKNWAWAFIRGLRDMQYDFPIRCDTLVPVHLPCVFHLLDAPVLSLWQGLDICPRTCPSQHATLCTYYRWFARPRSARRVRSFLQLPLTARCMRCFLRFRMGCHGLPNVLGRRSGTPRAARHCQLCDGHVLGDELHLVFECPSLQHLRGKFAALFGPGIDTMQQFMWQADLLNVARFILESFEFLRERGGG